MPHMANLPWLLTYTCIPMIMMILMQKMYPTIANTKSSLTPNKMQMNNKWSW